jgi:hypothetical protein
MELAGDPAWIDRLDVSMGFEVMDDESQEQADCQAPREDSKAEPMIHGVPEGEL